MWDLPGSGIEPMSLTFADGFFTTQPQGKPHFGFLIESYHLWIEIVLLLPFQCGWFCFSCLRALARTLGQYLIPVVKAGVLVLFAVLGGTLSVSHCWVSWCPSVPFVLLRKFYSSFLSVFLIVIGCWILSDAFSATSGSCVGFSPLRSVIFGILHW